MITKYINKSLVLNKKKSLSLLISSAVSICLILIFTLVFLSTTLGLKEKNNQQFGEFNYQIGYIEPGKYFDNVKVKQLPIPYEKLDHALIIRIDSNVTLWGVQPQGMELNKFTLLEGQKVLSDKEVLVNKIYASTYHVKIGDAIDVFDGQFKVAGIINNTAQDSLASKIFMDLSTAQKYNHTPQQFNLLQIKNNLSAEENKSSLSSYFDDKSLRHDTMKNKQNDYKKIQVYEPLFYILLVGMLATYITALYGTLKIRLHSRLPEITMLKRIGIVNKKIYLLLIEENSLISLLGSLVGAIVGSVFFVLFKDYLIKQYVIFQSNDISKILLLSLVFICVNTLIVSIISFFVVYALKNLEAEEIKNNKPIATKHYKLNVLLAIVAILYIVAYILDISTFNYIVIGIILLIPLFILRKIIYSLNKLSDKKSLFKYKYIMKSLFINYKKYAVISALMATLLVTICLAFTYLNDFSFKVEENIKRQMPADYIIMSQANNLSENFLSQDIVNKTQEIIGQENSVPIYYSKDYEIASPLNYSPSWQLLTTKSNVPINFTEILKMDINKKNGLRSMNVIAGKALNEAFEPDELLMNDNMVKQLNVKLNDQIKLTNKATHETRTYKIVTILDVSFISMTPGFIAPSNSYISTDHVSSIEIYHLLDKQHHQLQQMVDKDTTVKSLFTADILKDNLQFFDLIFYILLFLNIFIGIIFIINIFNVMLLSIEERKREIKLLIYTGVIQKIIKFYMLSEIFLVIFLIIIVSFVLTILAMILLFHHIYGLYLLIVYVPLMIVSIILYMVLSIVLKKSI